MVPRLLSVCLLASAASLPAYAQVGPAPGPATPLPQDAETLRERSALDSGGSCTIPQATIVHSPVPGTPAAAQLRFLSPSADPDAVCNDGTRPAYLVRPGSSAGAHRWVVELQGGFECYDQASCALRAKQSPTLVSSTPYRLDPRAAHLKGGIESPDPAQNPDFYDANFVKVFYCSSDYWSGTRAGTGRYSANAVGSWNFQGHAILNAVLHELIETYNLGSAGDELLLTGTSAGGIGVIQNVNDVAATLPLGVRMLAAPDAGFGNADYPAYDPATGGMAPGTTPYEQLLTDGQSLWGARGDPVCLQSAHTPGQVQNCLKPTVIAANGYVHVPMFIRQSLDDHIQLSMNNITFRGGKPAPTAGQTAYVDAFGPSLAQSLASTDAIHSVFGVTTYDHVLIDGPTFTAPSWKFGGGGQTSIAAALGAFYRQPCEASRQEQSGIPAP